MHRKIVNARFENASDLRRAERLFNRPRWLPLKYDTWGRAGRVAYWLVWAAVHVPIAIGLRLAFLWSTGGLG